ncbi:MAG: Holliday junction branch migration protein RuvA [Fervidobacterium sp.]|nr:Holliday junction branch migration protein RuvA [Fervidobacterium sp.]
MIEIIEGIYVGRSEGKILVSVGGIVLGIYTDAESFSEVQEGVKIAVFAKVIISQDDILLYGFDSKAKKEAFEKLIKVSKLGPKTAVKILSATNVQYLSNVISSGDVEKLASIPGIGKKTAERIIAELKDEFEPIGVDEKFSEAIEALVSLGYSKIQARMAVNKVIKEFGDNRNVSQVIKEALKVLVKM